MARPVYIAGHSLGAAEAALYAFDRIKRGLRVDGLFLFGCPRPGNRVIADHLLGVGLKASVRNGRDLVTEVPLNLELLGDSYVAPMAQTEGNAAPAPGDEWGPFAWHHIELYQRACRSLKMTELVPIVNVVAGLYYDPQAMDWLHPVDGQFWGACKARNASVLIARGSVTVLDWLHDFDALMVPFHDARVSQGFLKGVLPIRDVLDQAYEEAAVFG